MENRDYYYASTPYSMAKVFDIHSLSQEGFNQYISPDSHIYNYIGIISQNNLKKFFRKKDSSRKSLSNSLISPLPEENKKKEMKII